MATEIPPTSDQLDHALAVAQIQTDPDAMPVILGFPLNRLLTIGRGPINVAAGTLASLLLVHLHFLAMFHVGSTALANGIAQGIVWVVTAVLTDRGIAQWVKGHHLDMTNKANELAAALAQVPPAQAVPALAAGASPAALLAAGPGHPAGGIYDPATAAVPELPTSPDVNRSGEEPIDPGAGDAS